MKKFDEFTAIDKIDIRLLENSIHFLTGEITEENISNCIKWLVYENLDTKQKVLTLYINSTGGDLYPAFALIDMMNTSVHAVRTIAVGSIMSAAFLIFATGTNGERYVSKNAGIMCHQHSDGTEGKYHDIKATMKENELINQKMINVLKQATGLTPGVIKKKLLSPSDVYLTANEAVELGIADHILGATE
jgi:ATP-dependent Clp endopeptidase proteolytic subunit ClpP